MSNFTKRFGGAQPPASTFVSADQTTIAGDGTAYRPLHLVGAGPEASFAPVSLHGLAFYSTNPSNQNVVLTYGDDGVTVPANLEIDAVVVAPVPLPVGFPIGRFSVVVTDGSGTPLHAQLITNTGVVATSGTSTQTGARQTIEGDAGDVIVIPGRGYFLKVLGVEKGTAWSVHAAVVFPAGI